MSQPLDLMTFPLRGSRLIEASAGTGKTFTLALLYVRLVLGHGADGARFSRPLTPREILVVTFTEAATEELRERIRTQLVEAADCFQAAAVERAEAAPGRSPLHSLRGDFAEERWPDCAYRLQLAAEGMDEAAIFTIHAWCNRMLLEHAFASRGLLRRTLNDDQSDLLAEVVRDYWRTHFYPLDQAMARPIIAAYASPSALLSALSGLLSQGYAGLSYCGEVLEVASLKPVLEATASWRQRVDELQAMEDEARAGWREHWPDIEAHLRELRPHLNGTYHASANPEKFEARLAALDDWARGGAAPDSLQYYAQGAFVFKGSAAVQREMTHPAFAALARRFDAEQSDPARYAPPEPSLAVCILAHAKRWVAEAMTRRKQQRGELEFDDLLTQLAQALDPAASGRHAGWLADAVRAQYPVAMIDEFQDTDPIQYRIFDRIYRLECNAPETALVLIGDPKQAIYSFRGADIHTYLAARRATAGRHHSLDVNYRSSSGLVNACNRLFSFAEAHDRAAFRFNRAGDNPIPFLPVAANGREDELYLDGRPVAAMTCWQLSADESIKLNDYRSRSAELAAAQIATWLQAAASGRAGFGANGRLARPLQPADIALLVRTSKEAARLREALAAKNINSVYLSEQQSVLSTQEAQDMLRWLKACAAPRDEPLLREALGSNTLDLPLERLAELFEDELCWERQALAFQGFHLQWQRRGVLAAIRSFVHHFELPSRLLGAAGGERRLTNILHLAEWLQQAAVGLDGEQALIRHLAEHLNQYSESFIMRLESDAALVKIITIHKSKGLEYPLVLLPFASDWRHIDGRDDTVFYRVDGARYLEIAGNKLFAEAWVSADDERLSEDLRLLYVAVTRASHALFVCVAPVKKGNAKKLQLQRSALGYVLNGGAGFDDAAAFHQALVALRGDCGDIALLPAPADHVVTCLAVDDAHLDPARRLETLSRRRWWIASYSALRYADGITESTGASDCHQHAGLGSPDTAGEDQALEEARATAAEAPPPTLPRQSGSLHTLPRGSRTGIFLHGLIEWAAQQHSRDLDGGMRRGFAAAVAAQSSRRNMLEQRCRLRGLAHWVEPLSAWLETFLSTEWQLTGLPGADGRVPAFSLASLSPRQCAVEMEFWMAVDDVDVLALDGLVTTHTLGGAPRPRAQYDRLNGLLKGFIDLVVEHQGRYYVIDWKSNWLGEDDDSYPAPALRDAVLSKRYDLQYVLYLLALHRQLRARLPDYSYERHIGGAIYVFLRGGNHASQGLFMDKPPRALIEQLDGLCRGRPPAATGASCP